MPAGGIGGPVGAGIQADRVLGRFARASWSFPATTVIGIGTGSVTGHDRFGEPWSTCCGGVILVS